MKNRLFVILFIFVLIALLTTQCGGGAAPDQKSSKKPDLQVVAPTSAAADGSLDGKTLTEDRCSACHSLRKAVSRPFTPDDWKIVVDNMIGRGANLSDAERTAVTDYLAKTYAK
ncbi:MAG: hypothetical protein WCI88_04765 [Chloroflexota bacterium]